MTPEQIKQMAIECGAHIMDWDDGHMLGEGDAILSEEQLQAFFTRAYELGRKEQRESDAKLCETHTYATGPMNEHGNTRYLIPFNNDIAGGLHHSGITYAEAIRNNTGE